MNPIDEYKERLSKCEFVLNNWVKSRDYPFAYFNKDKHAFEGYPSKLLFNVRTSFTEQYNLIYNPTTFMFGSNSEIHCFIGILLRKIHNGGIIRNEYDRDLTFAIDIGNFLIERIQPILEEYQIKTISIGSNNFRYYDDLKIFKYNG